MSADVEVAAGEPGASGTPAPRIGELLLERGLIQSDQLEFALDLQRTSSRRMGETLVAMGAVSSSDLARVLAERLGRPFVDLSEESIDFLLANRIPEETARRYSAVPVRLSDGQLLVAMADPTDVFALDDLRFLTGLTIVAAFADPVQLQTTISRIWARANVDIELGSAAEAADEDVADFSAAVGDDEAPIIRLVNALIDQAIDERASDVHLEPSSRAMQIRFRIDGILHDVSEAPLSVARALVSRVKVLANIDIANARVPHDGRFTVTPRGRSVDIRVVTLPTASGEAVVMRLLDRSQSVMTFDRLGLGEGELDSYIAEAQRPQGAILMTGPTGSGKTSTLYATAAMLNSRERAIVTVEDPVEYRLDGIKQIQIHAKAGRTFPGVLRAVLRADPDVILVGEIRDHETARIAAEAAITGHLVLSTLHTTSAAATPLRLADMGVEPYLVASAVTCVAGQRLIRRLCAECAEPDPRATTWLRSLDAPDAVDTAKLVRRAVGCSACQSTGYMGRVAIVEVLVVSDDVKRLIVARAPSHDIERWAVAEGMNPLRTIATRRVLEGITSIDEMMRVAR